MGEHNTVPAGRGEAGRLARQKAQRPAARIEDVAKAAGVSIMSVSRAMRGVEGVSAATRARILAVAEDMRYSPSSLAGSLATANSTLIGISVPTLHDEVFSDIFDAMRATFNRAGFQTVFDTTEYAEEREEAWVERMVAWRSAGLVLSGTVHSEATQRLLRRAGMPVLEIWDHSEDAIDMVVGIDHRAAGYAMGRAMVAAGYRRPAYVGPLAGYDARAERRLAGFREAFAEAGAGRVSTVRMGLPHSFEGGLVGTRQALDADGPRPDLIYYLNDHMAFGGMMECERRGIDVPGEIGLAGFNGLSLNNVLGKRLTTSRTPRRAIGEDGARMLVARILGARVEASAPMAVRLELGDTTRLPEG